VQGFVIECERCHMVFALCRPCYRGTKYCEACRRPAREERVRGYRAKYAATMSARLLRVERNARARKKTTANETDPALTFTPPPAHGEPREEPAVEEELGHERVEEAEVPSAAEETARSVEPSVRCARCGCIVDELELPPADARGPPGRQ
jgi:hypothetical protein